MASGIKQSYEIKDSKLWLIPFGTLCTMIVAGCIAIVLLANVSFPGLFRQVDLGIIVSQESLNSFEQKVNLTVDTSIQSKSLKTHTFSYEGENYLDSTPINSEEFSSFISYIQPADSPISSTQIKFSNSVVEVSTKMSLSNFTELISGENKSDDESSNYEPQEPGMGDMEIIPMPDGETSVKVTSEDYMEDFTQDDYQEEIPSDDYEEGNKENVPSTDYDDEHLESDNADDMPEGLKKLLSKLPDTVNVYAKGSGIIIDNKITNFNADIINVSGFNLASFVGEEEASKFAEEMINGILSLMNEKFGMYFEYTEFVGNEMIFTGVMPEKITMVEIENSDTEYQE